MQSNYKDTVLGCRQQKSWQPVAWIFFNIWWIVI